MTTSSLLKELKLLCRDLHGLAVLFVMPIAFMLIMSLALSRDQDPHTDSRIALVGAADDSVNTALAAALEKEQIHVTRMPSEKLTDAQNGLHDKRFQLVLHNPNPASGKIADDKALQIYVPPDIEPSWLAAVKGILQQHYTQTRLDAYFDNNDGIKIDNKKLPHSIRKDIQKKVDEKNDEQFTAVRSFLDKKMLEEHYLSAGSGTVEKPNAVQHSVPAWLIFGMFFIMIPLSNVMALERQTNTITRLRLARASASGLIAAKLVPYFLINQLQFVGMLLLGRYLLPEIGVPALILNGSLVPYALLSAAVSAAALGYALLISVCAKSTEHAVVLGGGGIILMAAIGGIMVPAHVMPETMQQLTWISPMAWGLKAFQELLLNRSGLDGIGRYLILLSAFSFATLTAAVLVYRRQLQTQVRF
ncbi:ABC transporter permease [Neisseria lactamica]|uniref:ABC transporter permease n=1 Tax=Neisseria lactamica TaxID=486 RepID=UPI00066EAD08|nr:ABC transporter permease [Neisseria lactamica]